MDKITDNIFQLNLGAVNVFFIVQNKDVTLVDTGTAGSTDKIFKALPAIGLKPENIKRILLTHLHPDHAGSAAEIKFRLNIPVYAHPADATLLEKGIAVRENTTPSPGMMNRLIYRLFVAKSPKTVAPVVTDFFVEDLDELPFAGGIRVVHTPGHSEGHVCFLLEGQGVLIAGDICANLFGLGFSTVYEDRSLGLDSLERIARMPFATAGFGHGSILRGNAAKRIASAFSGIN